MNVLNRLAKRYPRDPKYLVAIAQVTASDGDLRGFERNLSETVGLSLGNFRNNLLFGVEGLFKKNRGKFSLEFLEILARYQPNVFL